ncbi:MAG: Uma2 family endonuclease [Catalinimonas sp.]
MQTLVRIDAEEYLRRERAGRDKHEFINGAIRLMPGASLKHNRIQTKLIVSLSFQVGADNVYGSDLRVHNPLTDSFCYPDVTVTTAPPRLLDETHQDVLLNPAVVFEILSPSTASYDQGDKFRVYRSLPDLHAYVMVWQDEQRVECMFRNERGNWEIAAYHDGNDALTLLDGRLRPGSPISTAPLDALTPRPRGGPWGGE